MGVSAKLIITGDAAERIREIAAQLKRPEAMWKELGRVGAITIRAHFAERDSEPNKHDWKKRHIWAEFRAATGNPELAGNGVEITISDARFAMKVYGGTVVPREAKALTIPLVELAYGRRASVFEQEEGVHLFHPKGTNVLMALLPGASAPIPIYYLASSQTIPADPHALPPLELLASKCAEQAEKHLVRALSGGGGIGQVAG